MVAAQLSAEGLGDVNHEAGSGLTRVYAWWVWPLVGALIDHSTYLARTMVLDGGGTQVDARGSQVWEIAYGQPRPRLSPL